MGVPSTPSRSRSDPLEGKLFPVRPAGFPQIIRGMAPRSKITKYTGNGPRSERQQKQEPPGVSSQGLQVLELPNTNDRIAMLEESQGRIHNKKMIRNKQTAFKVWAFCN